MTCFSQSLLLNSPEQTARVAEAIGRRLEVGDTLLLEGGIGAGKTHFARALIQSLLVEMEDVPSPTFTLVQTYETPPYEIWHADLYRLADSSELVELGLMDAFDEAVCLIEWPDRLGADAPETALRLSFELTEHENERRLTISGPHERWHVLANMDIM